MILSRPAIHRELDSGGLMFLQLSDPLEEDEGYGGRPQDIFQGQSAPIPQRRT